MCLLCGFKDLPEHLQFNPNVWEGYRRCPSSLLECTGSIFQWHNESVNIWTHLLPALVVAWSVANELVLAEVNWYRLYLLFSLAIIFVGSSAYHTYMPACRTPRQYTNLLLYDLVSAVGGMALMSHSFIAWGYRCWTVLPTFIWAAFFLFSLAMIRLAITATTARERVVSLGGFCFVRAVLGVTVFVPRIMAIGVTPAFVYHFFSGVLIFLGGFINAQRFPERFWPGAFDYTIHSHGLWHVCALLSAYAGYCGNLADLADYAATPCPGTPSP